MRGEWNTLDKQPERSQFRQSFRVRCFSADATPRNRTWMRPAIRIWFPAATTGSGRGRQPRVLRGGLDDRHEQGQRDCRFLLDGHRHLHPEKFAALAKAQILKATGAREVFLNPSRRWTFDRTNAPSPSRGNSLGVQPVQRTKARVNIVGSPYPTQPRYVRSASACPAAIAWPSVRARVVERHLLEGCAALLQTSPQRARMNCETLGDVAAGALAGRQQ